MKGRLAASVITLQLLAFHRGWAAEPTVTDFLTPPPLGEAAYEQEIAGKVAVQKTPGRHQGHRILVAIATLQEPGSKAERRYAIRYNACLEVAEHPGAVDVAAKEGLSGIGLVGPSSANFYGAGCIDVRVNGATLGHYKPRLTRTVYKSGAVAAKAAWNTPQGKVALTFAQLPGEDFCRVVGELDCADANSIEVRLRAYPGMIRRTGERVVWTSRASKAKLGSLLASRRDCWFLMADQVLDCAKNKRAKGPCAVMFTPSEVTSASVSLSRYAVDVRLLLGADAKAFHLALWEFTGWSNVRALEHMRSLGKQLRVEIGRAATAAVVQGPPRAIVVNHKPAATIVLPAEPSDRLLQAAMELQEYVAKSTAAVLPIVTEPAEPRGHVIALRTQQPPAGESREAFRITVSDRRTDIVGNNPLAALYAAYDLLERAAGVRWYLPGPLGEVVPKHATLVLPALDMAQSPSFPMRWIGLGAWSLRNKQNRCDDGFLIYPGIYHTQNRLLPHSEYFPTQPEFFALIHGKRSAYPQCKLCYSNPDVARAIAHNMAAMLDANPDIKLISLSPTDGQQWCECEGCRSMDPEGVVPNKRPTPESGVPPDRAMSRRSLLFYNAVAAELRKTHPDAQMLVGAYNVYNVPPEGIKADPMLNVIITHYEDYCMAHPVADPDCPRNRRYVRLIKQWQALGCRVYFYEYYWKVNWLDLPWPIVHSIRADMPWYKRMGCQGVYTQFSTQCIWEQYQAHYVAARLLWDADADVDAIVDKMNDDLFGAASPHMKAYYALMEKQMAECGKHFPGQGLNYGPAVFTDDVRAQLRQHYQAALEANQDPVVARRLAKIGASLEYTDRLMEFAALCLASNEQADPAKALHLAQQALDVGEKLVNEIRTDRKKWNGIVSMTVVSDRAYLGRSVNAWRKAVNRRRLASFKRVAPLPKTWKFALDEKDVGQREKWFAPEFDDAAWKHIQIGRTWESQGYEYDGFAWYRVKFTVKKEWLAKPLSICFGAVDGEAWVWWNGALLGHHKGWDEPFGFALDPKQIKLDAPNTIAVRVWDGANAGGIYKYAYLGESR